MIETDGDLVTPGTGYPHPRSYGSFPRVLARYVREQGVLSLEKAVHKMTALPAAWLEHTDRGTLLPGRFADVTVFDADTVRDVAEYTLVVGTTPYDVSFVGGSYDSVYVSGVPRFRDDEPHAEAAAEKSGML